MAKRLAIPVTTALLMHYNLALSLVEIEHDAASLVDGVRTDLHKVGGPRVAGRSYFESPHRALDHDMLRAIERSRPSSAE